jgi:hypothetical protein
MKHKLSILLTILLSTVSINASNPLTANMSKIAAITSAQEPLTTTQLKSAIQQGKLNDALYMRMLLSEFYCARCAIGITPFNTTRLAPQNNWSNWLTVKKPSGLNIQPGGFMSGSVNNFIKYATSCAKALRTERLKLQPTGQIPNPLETFKGVILLLDEDKLGDIIINGNIYSGSADAPVWIEAGALSSNKQTVSVSASGQLASASETFVDLTLTAWAPKNKYGSPHTFNNKPFPTLFKSITGTLLGGTISPFYIFSPQHGAVGNQGYASFFKNAPNNPWALVVKVTASVNKITQKIAPTATILAMVQLNPLDFPPKTSTPLLTLLNYPKALYYSTTIKPTNPTAKLGRAITNGYLTSWKYKALVDPKPLLQPNSAPQPQSLYPTPSAAEFRDNNPNTMIKALYAYRQALGLMYIHKSDIPHLKTIISSPTTSTGSYIGTSGTTYMPVLSLQKTSSASSIKTAFNTITSHLMKPLRKIKNLFSKRITL